jgi:rhodanese-related sulfurtransferase
MRTLLVISLLAFAATAGCSRHHDEVAAQPPEVAAVSVDQLDRMLADHRCQAVDANGELTRRKMGVIPGAVLLVDDSIANLPADKSKGLVFYCANPACGASHEAATKAILAGYSNVKVLPDGIAGWVKAGKQTTSI